MSEDYSPAERMERCRSKCNKIIRKLSKLQEEVQVLGLNHADEHIQSAKLRMGLARKWIIEQVKGV